MKVHSTPPPTFVSLRKRLQNACNSLELAEPRARRQLAVIFVGQMLAHVSGAVAIKGASQLEARLGIEGSRVSRDLDSTIAIELETFTEELRALLEVGWEGFTGILSEPEMIRAPVPEAYRPHRFKLKVQFFSRALLTLTIEVSPDELGSLGDIDEVDPLPGAPWFEGLGLPAPAPIPMLRLDHQIAQKLHACTTPDTEHWTNGRSHDLVDLQLAQPLYGEPDDRLRETVVRLFSARDLHPWPPTITARADWAAAYPTQAADLPVVATLDEAIAWGQDLIVRIGR